jgi:hypothetical protein
MDLRDTCLQVRGPLVHLTLLEMWSNLVTIKENVEQEELDTLPHYLILTPDFLGVDNQIEEYQFYSKIQ